MSETRHVTPGPYSQGRTLSTAQTRRWTPAQIEANERIERRLVFANFNAVDQGRGRILIARCEREEDAAFIVEACNKAWSSSPAETHNPETKTTTTTKI